MKSGYVRGFAAILLASTITLSPASAIDLLGAATVNDDATGEVVDVEIGGDDSAVSADVLPGSGGSSAANATVTTDDGLGANVRIGRSVNANARIGGSSGAVDANVGIGGDGSGGAGTPGTGTGANGVAVQGGSSGSGAATSAGCVGNDPNEALSLFEGTALSGWERASNIEIVPLHLCAAERSQVAQIIQAQQAYARLQSAVANDELISAALRRTSYGADQVLGVAHAGSQLTVYVY